MTFFLFGCVWSLTRLTNLLVLVLSFIFFREDYISFTFFYSDFIADTTTMEGGKQELVECTGANTSTWAHTVLIFCLSLTVLKSAENARLICSLSLGAGLTK